MLATGWDVPGLKYIHNEGHVKRQIQHKAKPSAAFVLRLVLQLLYGTLNYLTILGQVLLALTNVSDFMNACM